MHTHTHILLALCQTALLGLAASLSSVVVNASFITRPPCLFFFLSVYGVMLFYLV